MSSDLFGKVKKLYHGYAEFLHLHHKPSPEYHQHIAKVGQTPHVMMIACCDARSDPAVIFQAKLGDIFVVRTIAAIVPEYHPDREYGFTAALQFAIHKLNIDHIIVMGHSQCGGMHKMVDLQLGREHESPPIHGLAQWLHYTQNAYDKTLTCGHDPEKTPDFVDAFTHESVLLSASHLMTYPGVREKQQDGQLIIQPCYYDIAHASVQTWSRDKHAFIPLEL